MSFGALESDLPITGGEGMGDDKGTIICPSTLDDPCLLKRVVARLVPSVDIDMVGGCDRLRRGRRKQVRGFEKKSSLR